MKTSKNASFCKLVAVSTRLTLISEIHILANRIIVVNIVRGIHSLIGVINIKANGPRYGMYVEKAREAYAVAGFTCTSIKGRNENWSLYRNPDVCCPGKSVSGLLWCPVCCDATRSATRPITRSAMYPVGYPAG